MRKLILFGLMAATALPSAVMAQSQGEVRHDQREVQKQREDLRDAQLRGDRKDVREQREDVRGARQELREDRRDNRSQYVAPYRGWSYSVVRPGSMLRSGFFGTRYVIANPNSYRLHAAGPNRQWIRYGNDIVLVNVRTGRVIEVMSNRY